MAQESQTVRIYKALQRGRKLTMASGFTQFRTLNLHKRISEIEKQRGIKVSKVTIKRKGRKLTQWYLP